MKAEREKEMKNERGNEMTRTQAEHIAMSIYQNERRDVVELTDAELESYLLDYGQKDSEKNVKMLRNI